MTTIFRDPAGFDDSTVDVELQVDRKLGMIRIFLNGDEAGHAKDPVKVIPSGQGIMFHSLVSGEDAQIISSIEVREWDASASRHGKEERGDITRDVLITRSSDRGTGRIVSMVPGPGGGTVLYRGPHHPDAVELPLAEISTMFFAGPGGEATPAPMPPLSLGLHDRGRLGINRCTFHGEQVVAIHPLLGELTIRRDAIASLQRDNAGARDEAQPEEAGE